VTDTADLELLSKREQRGRSRSPRTDPTSSEAEVVAVERVDADELAEAEEKTKDPNETARKVIMPARRPHIRTISIRKDESRIIAHRIFYSKDR
jgi:hypothetical protein